MSACILTGFAKKRKFVGTMYACNGSDLPATRDFGTVQFSGPYESAQAVPATTITYTIIGKTPCGNDVRRIITKTYSSRSIANQYKFPVAWTGTGNFSPSGFTGNIIGYGATLSDAQLNARLGPISYGVLGALYIGGGTGSGVDTITSISDGGVVLNLGIYYSYVIGYFAHGNAYTTIGTTNNASIAQITIYYIDVHEVWTYDLV